MNEMKEQHELNLQTISNLGLLNHAITSVESALKREFDRLLSNPSNLNAQRRYKVYQEQYNEIHAKIRELREVNL